jgi:hypothetical protein
LAQWQCSLMSAAKMRRPRYQTRQWRVCCSGETSCRASDLDMDACTCWHTRACDIGGIRKSTLADYQQYQQAANRSTCLTFNNHGTCVGLSSPSTPPHNHMQSNRISSPKLVSDSLNGQHSSNHLSQEVQLSTNPAIATRKPQITPRAPERAGDGLGGH